MLCYRKSRKGQPAWNKGKPAPWAIGNQHRKGMPNVYWKIHQKEKIGEKNNKWLGNKVGYYGLHRWVRFHLGKPQKCEHCGIKDLKPRQYHWANKSHKYLRDLNDWIRLCAKCHKAYDR